MFNSSNRNNKKQTARKLKPEKGKKALFLSKPFDYKKAAIKEWDTMAQNPLTYIQGLEKLRNSSKLSLLRVLL